MRHAALCAKGPTLHCGRRMCERTTPDPDAWETSLKSNPTYDPECCCPCLACHPREVSYDAALRVVRESYGPVEALSCEQSREAALKVAAA